MSDPSQMSRWHGGAFEAPYTDPYGAEKANPQGLRFMMSGNHRSHVPFIQSTRLSPWLFGSPGSPDVSNRNIAPMAYLSPKEAQGLTPAVPESIARGVGVAAVDLVRASVETRTPVSAVPLPAGSVLATIAQQS